MYIKKKRDRVSLFSLYQLTLFQAAVGAVGVGVGGLLDHGGVDGLLIVLGVGQANAVLGTGNRIEIGHFDIAQGGGTSLHGEVTVGVEGGTVAQGHRHVVTFTLTRVTVTGVGAGIDGNVVAGYGGHVVALGGQIRHALAALGALSGSQDAPGDGGVAEGAGGHGGTGGLLVQIGLAHLIGQAGTDHGVVHVRLTGAGGGTAALASRAGVVGTIGGVLDGAVSDRPGGDRVDLDVGSAGTVVVGVDQLSGIRGTKHSSQTYQGNHDLLFHVISPMELIVFITLG